ncbi:DUF397 domain-containing protein [Streptosporangium sp. NPDC051023]|uniref:DUF397 domain-containing protein n=1 Tax=Streptosporangium sp. NPDC051023 TaxID=3155410 RepID=UPI00344C1B81
MDDLNRAEWMKSSLSGPDGGECVEIAMLLQGRVGVRDSKDSAGPALVFAPGEWTTFVESIKGGHFG